MKELVIQVAIAVLVSGGLIGYGIKKLIEYVKSTENKIDDAAIQLIPAIIKAVKNGLQKAGLNQQQVIMILNEIKQEYVEQIENTNGVALEEMQKAEEEAKKQ